MAIRDSRFSGNCGMFAIALARAAQASGRGAMIVIAHDARTRDHFIRGQFHLYHVAVDIDGVLCDARGHIATERDILSFMASPPEAARIDRFLLDGDLSVIIRRKTRWTVSFEKYAGEAERLVQGLARGSILAPPRPGSRPR